MHHEQIDAFRDLSMSYRKSTACKVGDSDSISDLAGNISNRIPRVLTATDGP